MNHSVLRKLGSNAFFLYISFGSNLLLPLIVIPHLAVTLGTVQLGSYIFVTSVTYFFGLVVNFGFNLTGTGQLATISNDLQSRSRLFFNIQTAKLGLLALCFALFILFTRLPTLSSERVQLLIGFIWVVGYALYTEWFFLGLEKMFIITIINLGTKLLFAVAILTTIRSPNDLNLALIWYSASMIFPGLASLFIALKHYVSRQYLTVSKSSILTEVKLASPVFFSQGASFFYTSINLIAIKLLLDNTNAGLFGIVERIVTIINAIFVPFNMAIFPYLNRLYTKDNTRFLQIVNRLLFAFLCLSFIVSTLLWLYASAVGKFFMGHYDSKLPTMIRLSTLATFAIPVGSFFTGIYTIIGRQKSMLSIIIAIAIFNCIALVPTLHVAGSRGVVLLLGANYVLSGTLSYAIFKQIFPGVRSLIK